LLCISVLPRSIPRKLSTAFWTISKPNRYEAVKKTVEAGGGKLISMYSTAAEGPGVLVIFDAEPEVAMSISGLAMAGAGGLRELMFMRSLTQDEVSKFGKRHVSYGAHTRRREHKGP
jgi:uncharacterized protein with GYD domain